jgi:hypothetical protein
MHTLVSMIKLRSLDEAKRNPGNRRRIFPGCIAGLNIALVGDYRQPAMSGSRIPLRCIRATVLGDPRV